MRIKSSIHDSPVKCLFVYHDMRRGFTIIRFQFSFVINIYLIDKSNKRFLRLCSPAEFITDVQSATFS